MDVSDDILGLPADSLRFREWWAELTGHRPGITLTHRLKLAVAAKTLLEVTDEQEQRWYSVVRGLPGAASLGQAVVCARLAVVDPESALAARWLWERFPWADREAIENGAIDAERWSAWLRDLIEQSPKGSLFQPNDASFSPAVAWDLVTRFWAAREDRRRWERRPLRSKELVTLFVDRRREKIGEKNVEYTEEGATAKLTLELLPDGRGRVFPDPEKLLFVRQDRSFREAIESALMCAQELLGSTLAGYDVRWSLTRHDPLPLTELSGGSAGAAFALGLAALMASISEVKATRKLSRVDLHDVGVTAELLQTAGGWRLALTGAATKVWAAAQRPELVRLVFVAPGQSRSDFPNLHVIEVSTLRELVRKLTTMPRGRRSPLSLSRTVGIVISALIAFAIAAYWAYRRNESERAAIEDAKNRELDDWRAKGLVSLDPSRYSPGEIAKTYGDKNDPLNVVQAHIYHKEFAEAQQALLAAARKGLSGYVRYYRLSGDVFYYQGRFDEAVPYYQLAVQKAGAGDIDNRSDLAMALGQSQGPHAAARIEQALRIQRQIIAQLEASRTESGKLSADASEKWAWAHLSLARLLIDRPQSRSRSVAAGLEALEKSLTVFTRQKKPDVWAYITSMQGVAWQNRPDGDRTDNLKHSIQYLQAALTEYRRQPKRLQKRIYFNTYMLGVAWGQLREGDREANLERALKLYRDAEDALGDLAAQNPFSVAMTERSRGLALIYRRRGDRHANLDEAIGCLRRALEAFESLNKRIDAEKARTDLARALLLRDDQSTRREDIETAIAYLEKAARFLNKKDFAVEWAQIQHDLGTAYRERVVGRPTANLEKSLACFKSALAVRIENGRADRVVTTLIGFGRTALALSNRGVAEVPSAISVFNDALKLLPGARPDPDEAGALKSVPGVHLQQVSAPEVPEYLAQVSRFLGDAWATRAAGDRQRNRRLALEHYEVAATYYRGIAYYAPEYVEIRRKIDELFRKDDHSRESANLSRAWRGRVSVSAMAAAAKSIIPRSTAFLAIVSRIDMRETRARHFGSSDRRFFLSNMPTRSVTLQSRATASRMIVVRLGTLNPRSKSLMYVYDMPARSASDRSESSRFSRSSRSRSPNIAASG